MGNHIQVITSRRFDGPEVTFGIVDAVQVKRAIAPFYSAPSFNFTVQKATVKRKIFVNPTVYTTRL